MEELPPDITLNILSRLPVESVLECKRVCKSWQYLLRDTKVGLLFSFCCSGKNQLYYTNSCYETLKRINHPPFSKYLSFDLMLGSCNGLVCFYVRHHGIDDPIYICNPITEEYLWLPRLTVPPTNDWRHSLARGFGYVLSTNEYKVIRIYYDDKPSRVGQVQVYTLGDGNGWKNKGEITNYVDILGCFANGVVHWIDMVEGKIVAFDLADEKFMLVELPRCLLSFQHLIDSPFAIRSLGGCLCVIFHNIGTNVEIWELKKLHRWSRRREFSIEQVQCWSWSRKFNIALEGHSSFLPLALTKSNQVLFLYEGILSCYDPKTATVRKLWDDRMSHRYVQVQAIPHTNTLVSLKALRGYRRKSLT